MSDWVDVAPTTELAPGQSRLVDIDNVTIAVFNLDGDYYAIEDTCSHNGAPLLGCGLEPDELINGNQIICPRHGARFCIRTGAALSPPAYEPVASFPVRIAGDIVQVRDNR
jgi:3-phenylpropionate/trans-cinnamate dioxygenase ferredoxin subunit